MDSRRYSPWLLTTGKSVRISESPAFRMPAMLFLLLCLAVQLVVALQNPYDDFCRRHGHQTTVIDDKLYIDGGYVNFESSFKQDHRDVPNTWNSFHDLNNNLTKGFPQLNINLNKDPRLIPTVAGGVLWGDSVNKKYYVYGGESTTGVPLDFHMFSYDILYDKWDDLGAPKISVPPNIASYGAGIGVSEIGQGYHYGGWIKNTSMRGWNSPPTMSSELYQFDYDANKLTLMNSPDKLGRAEGAMVWIPAGDPTGLLVYFGGLVDSVGNGTRVPQPMDKILVFDPTSNSWFTQTATGEIPQNRSQFCASAAWAPDRSSYNIYLWGGLSAPPPAVNVTAFNDNYVLSLPSFTWAKLWPDHHGNATGDAGHYSASCNMVKSLSQMFVIGGIFPNSTDCDGAKGVWGQHDFWTGTLNNQGNNDTYWANYNPNITTNVVPVDIYSVIGGDKNGGATLLSPKGGYDSGNSVNGLSVLLSRKPNIQSRTATRVIPGPSSSPAPSPPHTSSPLSKGAIAGIVIGSVIGLAIIAFVWFLISKRVHRRRQERRQSQMTQALAYPSGYTGVAPNFVSPDGYVSSPTTTHASYGHPPPTEMPSGTEKPYLDRQMSPASGKYDSYTAQQPPTEVPAAVPVEVPAVSPSRSPDPANTHLASTTSVEGTPSPVTQETSPNFSSVADHGWTTYQTPYSS